MSRQEDIQISTSQPPTTNNRDEWRIYWKRKGQSWRTEPEISRDRQLYLTGFLSISSYLKQGKWWLQGLKLNRADLEWILLAQKERRLPIGDSSKSDLVLHLDGADLSGENLDNLPLAGTSFVEAHLEDVHLDNAHLENAYFSKTHLDRAHFEGAHLENANLEGAYMMNSNFSRAHLEGAFLYQAHLERAFLSKTHLEGANLELAHLEGSYLCDSYFSGETNLKGILLNSKGWGAVSVADIHWSDANVAAIDWSRVNVLGDEERTKQLESRDKTGVIDPIAQYQTTVRAYRQLSVVLRNQGLNENAARFAYRAQLMQRKVLWHQHRFGQYFFSLFLDLLAGYGYKPERSFLAYLLVIVGFAASYYLLGLHDVIGPHQVFGPHHLTWYESIVVSMTAFHGRGFFTGAFQPGDPQAFVAALEAFVGLLIEVTFIATLTQRLFGK